MDKLMTCLTVEELSGLRWLYQVHEYDTEDSVDCVNWGGIIQDKEARLSLKQQGLIAYNGAYQYITQAGADYLGFQTIIIHTPFDNTELTAARAEIARLTAALEASERANAELTEKLKIADAGWAECIGSGRNPWSTAQEFKRRQNDIRKRYRGE